jgi:hypothetical protein
MHLCSRSWADLTNFSHSSQRGVRVEANALDVVDRFLFRDGGDGGNLPS